MTPKFSIIIPVYNVAPYLRECLDSVLAQTFTDWEAICVDDGSTDGSGAILDEYAAKDSRFRVIHQENAGVSAARNAALDRAFGEWVMFLDGDDIIRQETLCWICDVLRDNPEVDALITNRMLAQALLPSEWPDLPVAQELSATFERNSISYGAARCTAVTTIFKRSKIGSLRFDTTYQMSEDTLFAVRYYWQTKSWIIASACWYFYRQRVGSAVNSKASLKAAKDFFAVETQMLNLLIEHRAEWQLSAMRDFFEWNESMVWYTSRLLYFRLSVMDMRQCLSSWLELNARYFDLEVRDSGFRNYAIRLIRKMNSPLICWFIVMSECRVVGFFRRLRSYLGLLRN